MKKLYPLLAIALVLSLVLAACAQKPPEPPADEVTKEDQVADETEQEDQVTDETEQEVEPIKIGILLPLSGNDAINGQQMQMAHDFAVVQINANGGIKCLGGAELQLVYADTQAKAESGNAETERLINQEGVIAIMGAYHSGIVLPTTLQIPKTLAPFLCASLIAKSVSAVSPD